MSEYETIKIKKETKLLLDKVLVEYESELGRKIGLDELILRLIIEANAKPELLRYLIENPVKEHNTEEALKILREERKRDERFRLI